MCLFDCFKTRKAKPPSPAMKYEDLFREIREPLVIEDEDYRYNMIWEPYDPNDPSILI